MTTIKYRRADLDGLQVFYREVGRADGSPLLLLHGFGTPGFPLSNVPLQQITADAAAGRLNVKPTGTFYFEEIREAHRVMESNEAQGKMVVVHAGVGPSRPHDRRIGRRHVASMAAR